MRSWLARLLFAVLLSTAGSVAAQDAAPVQGMAGVAATAAQRGTVRVIARLANPQPGQPLSESTVASGMDRVTSMMRAAGVGRMAKLGSQPLVVMEVTPEQLDALARSGLIESVQEDRPVPPSLAESTLLVGAPQVRAGGATGAGWAVAILDTGVQPNHPFLAGRIVAEACFSTTTSFSSSLCPNGSDSQIGAGAGANCPGFIDGCHHGTHVAGIAAGHFYQGGPVFSGVALEAGIIAIQVFSRFDGLDCLFSGLPSPCTLSFPSDQIRALDYLIGLAPSLNIAAVNMSLGGGVNLTACDGDLLKPAIDRLRTLGVATVIAAGNEGSNVGVSNPACISTAIAVGSTTDFGAEVVSSFSNSSALVDLLAPGQLITSSIPPSTFLELQGTSMAAPHVAGAFAALRSKYPTRSVFEIEQALVATGRQIIDPDNVLVRPRIDLVAADLVLSGAPLPTWQPYESFAGQLGSHPDCLASGSTQIDCWARLASGELGWWRYDGATIPAPTSLGGFLSSAPSCLAAGGALHCFAILGTRQLGQVTMTAAGWGPWQSLGQSLKQRPACASPDGVAITCLAIGSNGKLRARTWSGFAWGGWLNVAGELTVSRPPTCYARAGGVDCLVVAGGDLLHLRRTPAGRWAPARNLGGPVLGSASCVAPNAAARACFIQGTDRSLRLIYFNGARWGRLVKLAGAAYSPPSCTLEASTGISCFTVSATGALQYKRNQGGVWFNPVSVGGFFFRIPPACVSPGAGRLDCFAVGAGGDLGHIGYR